jgi:hypothetical protein
MASGPARVHQERHVYGPRPLGALVPAIARPAFRRRSPAAAQVMADWPAIVGPRLAAITTPRRLSAGRLTLACAGPVAMELQHLAPELIARINTHLGAAVVERLGFTQDIQDAAPPAKPARKPTAETIRRADAAVAELPEGELRAALAALGRAVLNARPTVAGSGGKRSTLPPPKQ